MRVLLALILALFATVADARPRGAPLSNQISYNIVSDGGAQCSGLQEVTRTVSINSGTAVLTTSTNTFVPGDAGSRINIPGAGVSGGNLLATILASPAPTATQVTLSANASTTLAAVSKLVTFGVDDSAAFATFNTWARANQGASPPYKQVLLTVPNGSVCYFGRSQSISGTILTNAWAAGIRDLIVEGSGARITGMGGAGFSLGGQGITQIGMTQATGQSARIQSVSAGATQLALTATSYAAGYISRFSVGQTIMLGGVDIQGLWNSPFGFPPNFQFFEWRTITAICNNTGPCTGGATITVNTALTNSYLDTWPNYNAGNAFEVDNGGPATIYAINDTWNMTSEYRGSAGSLFKIDNDGQTYAGQRNVTFRYIDVGGLNGLIPSQNETFSVYNTTQQPGSDIEVDKLIGSLRYEDTSLAKIVFQSSSVDSLVMKNTTISTSMLGQAKNSSLTDVTIAQLRFGISYGVDRGKFECLRCAVSTYDFGGLDQTQNDWTSWTGGVITVPNVNITGSGPLSRILIPGANLRLVTSSTDIFNYAGYFQVGAVTQDATNVYAAVSPAGYATPPSSAGFPGATSTVKLSAIGIPQFTCDTCTGASHFAAQSIQAGATPLAPPHSYGKTTYAPSASGAQAFMRIIGNLSSYSVNVTTASTHTGAITLNGTGQFGVHAVKQSDWTDYAWNPVINLKQIGNRVITPSGASPTTTPRCPSNLGLDGGILGTSGRSLAIQPTAVATFPRHRRLNPAYVAEFRSGEGFAVRHQDMRILWSGFDWLPINHCFAFHS
jgi:hypothetical protein